MHNEQTASNSLHPPVIAGVPRVGRVGGFLCFNQMKTYSEKLKDPRWQQFRSRVFSHYGLSCESCGESKPINTKNHVHHKRYLPGYEPWDYDMTDVCVLCPECHDELHSAENSWRNLIRSSPSWLAFYFQRLADTFSTMKDPHDIQEALVYKRHAAENMRHGIYPQEENRTMDQVLADILKDIEQNLKHKTTP